MKSSIHQDTNRKNLLQLLWLRLIAIISQIFIILFVNYFLQIPLPLFSMFLILAILSVLTLVSFYRYQSANKISNRSLFFEMFFDVIALTAELYFSGGVSNPFISLFILQVVIGAILLEATYAWLIVLATIACYTTLSFNYQELHIFHNHNSFSFFNLHLHGMLISYVLASVIVLIFITKITKNLKERDLKISHLKQQSLEKEQLIRMGLLTTGAAHELGTPLSTISIIISDLKKTKNNSNLAADLKIIESQLERCKKIISKILSSSGNTRSEKTRPIATRKFLDQLVREWKNSRNPKNLICNFRQISNTKIIFDDLLLQAFFNLLDNALIASPDFVLIEARTEKDYLVINIEDQGRGFEQKILDKIGRLNFSTKGSSGIGIFLAINILENFNATLSINNLKNGGAKIIIKIPLIQT